VNGRYSRQIPVFGEEGQARIQSARVGIAGCGGLGVNVATQLAMAGVGAFMLADDQMPDITNLNRQFIYAASDFTPKCETCAQWMLMLNPVMEVECHAERITSETYRMFEGCDVIVDCLDNMESRMILSDASEELGIPLVHGGISGMNGQIAVCIPGETPSLREILGTVPGDEGEIPVFGAAVSVIAGMEATEVLKLISGTGSPAKGRLIAIDLDDWHIDDVSFE
jgi:molybdopterin/thiamine biosynthesis adenylyltransferase